MGASPAQTQSSASPVSDPTATTQTQTPTPEKPDPSTAPLAPSGSIPTSAQVQAAGAADPAANAKPAPAVAPNGVNASQPNLAPKYNVSLIGQRNVGNGLDFYSLDREMALGRQLSQEVESSAKLVTDPVINEYVNRIGQNLVRNSDARVPFTIKVLDNDEVNAFALPGGFFYVDSGLILAADNEAELAGVMAHEIAHVAARHATKNMTRAQIWNFASVPLIFVGGPVAYAVAEAAGLLVPLGFLKFSRDAEREADLLGLQYDYASGYDPEAFVEFFEKLNVEKKKPNVVAKAFATHPMNVERIKDAQDEIRKYLPDRPEYVVDTSEFESVKTRLEMLENSRHLGGVKPTPGRPVLLKRASTSGPSGSDDSAQTPADHGKPTLKRAPGSTSTPSTDSTTAAGANSAPATSTPSTPTSNGGSTDAAQTAGTTPSSPDDDRPVLKRNPSSTSD
jgi:predicted Zn-dependent protease